MMILMDNHSPYLWMMDVYLAHGCPWRLNPRFLDGWFQGRVQYKHVRLKIHWEHVQTILLGFSRWMSYWSTCRCALECPDSKLSNILGIPADPLRHSQRNRSLEWSVAWWLLLLLVILSHNGTINYTEHLKLP